MTARELWGKRFLHQSLLQFTPNFHATVLCGMPLHGATLSRSGVLRRAAFHNANLGISHKAPFTQIPSRKRTVTTLDNSNLNLILQRFEDRTLRSTPLRAKWAILSLTSFTCFLKAMDKCKPQGLDRSGMQTDIPLFLQGLWVLA